MYLFVLFKGQEERVQQPNSLIRESSSAANNASWARARKRKAPKSRAEPITRRVKPVDANCADKLFNDRVPTDDLEQIRFQIEGRYHQRPLVNDESFYFNARAWGRDRKAGFG